MWVQFKDLAVGLPFHCNGNDYVKQSTRTARLLIVDRVFYFGQKEIIKG
jgi:hypothetical protein